MHDFENIKARVACFERAYSAYSGLSSHLKKIQYHLILECIENHDETLLQGMIDAHMVHNGNADWIMFRCFCERYWNGFFLIAEGCEVDLLNPPRGQPHIFGGYVLDYALQKHDAYVLHFLVKRDILHKVVQRYGSLHATIIDRIGDAFSKFSQDEDTDLMYEVCVYLAKYLSEEDIEQHQTFLLDCISNCDIELLQLSKCEPPFFHFCLKNMTNIHDYFFKKTVPEWQRAFLKISAINTSRTQAICR